MNTFAPLLSPSRVSFAALEGIPEVLPGADLAPMIAAALERGGYASRDDDVLIVCQKVVSKSEGRLVNLADVHVSARAREIAASCLKDERLVEVILSESSEVVRCAPHVLIVRHRLGFVMANAGVDQSNVPGSGSHALLLPENPDASAARLRHSLAKCIGSSPAVLVTDTFGRPWRRGVCGTAIGAAGLVTLWDRRGERDRTGRELKVTQVAVADGIAAAAALLMGEAAEGRPVVLARGLLPAYRHESAKAGDVLRPIAEDLFR
jgi:coenzyme F420-0:L-glutamate ligase/coenzyme F420-1:gamma-L-glutamate ligase